jgi:hypothetical protein
VNSTEWVSVSPHHFVSPSIILEPWDRIKEKLSKRTEVLRTYEVSKTP